MLETSLHKVGAQHLEREACLYVRQSSLRQVERNTESARRQYELRCSAVRLGWTEDRIRVIDGDQGKSGASSENRSGFRDLMARIAAGEVGLVLSLEVSRLARNNADWHQLLRVAAITDTLILDETGVHDPADGNDMLLLGFKGAISEFELQGIKARLVGGQRSKARRGELKLGLPIGLAYDAAGAVVLDSNPAIAGALRAVFDTFRRKGSASATVQWLRQEGITLPSRPPHGPNRGQVRWRLPSCGQVCQILRNPRYAGAFVYGRTASQRQTDGTVVIRSVPSDRWQVCLPEAHPGYIGWEEYRRNQDTLARNRAGFATGPARSVAPRDGEALLQSRVLCGICGRRMKVRYARARPARNEPARYYYRCDAEALSCLEPTCQSVRGDIPDAALSRFAVKAVNRESIDFALAVRDQVVEEFAAADAQRARRIEGLRYEADLARRRLFEVDPANRLVAAALEADWNDRLRALQDAHREREERAATREEEISADRMRRVRELAQDFVRVWDAPGTANSDRKRLIGLLVEDVTLTRDGYESQADVRLRGGKVVTLGPLPMPRPHRIASPIAPETVAAADELLDQCNDSETAGELNRAGHASGDGKPWTARRVQWLRQRGQLASHAKRRRQELARQGYMTAKELGRQLCLAPKTVRRHAAEGRLLREMIHSGGRAFTMYKQDYGSGADPDLVEGAS